MRRLVAMAAAFAVGLGPIAPAVLAADPLPDAGHVLISVKGDLVIPPGDRADVVLVVDGSARVSGEVRTLIVVDGSADLLGAKVESVVALRGQVEVGPNTVVSGEIRRLDSSVHQTGNAVVQGGITDLAPKLLELGGVVATALLLLWIGFGVANVVAGLFLAAAAARQLRSAQAMITREPALAAVSGLLAAIVVPVLAVLLFPTVILAPLGFGILVVALPLVAFGGYVVAALWVGDWLLHLAGDRRERERPYLAVVVGVVALGLLGMVPVAALLVAVASLVGFGAVIVQGARTIFGGNRPIPAQQPLTAATGA